MTRKTTTALARRVPSSPMQTNVVIDLRAKTDSDTNALQELQFISNSALKLGTHIVAGVGAGKSRLLGRVFAWTLLQSKKPGAIIDPTGGVVDSLFDKILRLPPEEQEPLWQHLKYIDAASKEYVVPTPLYYRQNKSDTLFEIANRLPSIFERQDPALANAPILGLNALSECAIYAGQIAAALGRQVDFVVDLIDHPGSYKVQLREALAEHAELQQAVSYFRELMDPTSAKLREKRTGSFKNKLLPFLADPTMLATFAGTMKRLNWKRAIRKRKIVLIDLRNERDPNRRQFKMIWYLKTFTDYIKYRGMAGRGEEVTLILDEITDMLGQRTKEGHSILAEDMEELITRLGRNFGVNVIAAHQNLSQIDERIQNVLMQMGNQLVGQLTSPDDAVRVARQLLRYNPYKIKKTENVYHTVTPLPILSYFGGPDRPYPQVIDVRTHEFDMNEQIALWVNKILDLDRFQFLAQLATSEGGKKGTVKKITIANLDKGQYPQEEILAPLRWQLTRRDGVPVENLLAEIRTNHTRGTGKKADKQTAQSATLNSSSIPSHVTPDYLSVTANTATPVSSASTTDNAPTRTDDEQVWQ